MKAIAEVWREASKAGYVTVGFADETTREYKIRYAGKGRRYIKVYGKALYDHRGKAI